MFWSRRRHKLPKFPPHVGRTFRMLCSPLNEEGLRELRAAVDQTMADLRGDEEKNPLAVEDGLACGECCLFLLDHYDQFPPSKQPLVVGAARYFAVADDPFDDALFASGYWDDKRVLNYVLEELDIGDRYFEVS